ncbi:hypothetical protein BCR32DRAFT_301814 [Anaeromyces robustus]|uniref:Uncharacterized protein n=1 Tax=Anaeromyces robustus TaxID=1754192 RepID=A0A1Y1WYX9_9FUNG|nr:hypothetical protein BCR32DRAFT_301814 [Anaeromyces robustus]|eukprot:ORX78304.1 hypothetical protein BCR32DRAFT_301814 [Anaeromyces robustus]
MSIQARTDGYIYKSGTATSTESQKFQKLFHNYLYLNDLSTITIDIKEVQVLFSMTKSNVIDYNQPYVWSIQAMPLAQWNNLTETPLNHNFQPNMKDSKICAVGLGNINGNKFQLDNCKLILPPGNVLAFIIEPEDKTTGATYYTEINVIYDNYW